MFNRILVALDGSPNARLALTQACDLAGKYGSELYLVHTPQIDATIVAVGAGAVTIPGDTDQIIQAGQGLLADAAQASLKAGVTAQDAHLGDGDPADDILKYADLMDIELIVMGRRGLGGIASLFLGSVSQKVTNGATCTCMTVRNTS